MKTLIKNGMIYDGTGNKPYPGDVLLKDDRILKSQKTSKRKRRRSSMRKDAWSVRD